VPNALGNRFIDSGGGGAQLRAGGGHTLGQGGLILLHGSLHPGFHHTIPQVLFLAHLHALDGGLNVRQLPSPPTKYFADNQHRLFYHKKKQNASVFFFSFFFLQVILRFLILTPSSTVLRRAFDHRISEKPVDHIRLKPAAEYSIMGPSKNGGYSPWEKGRVY
jgi:hypothetical protein